MTKKYTKNAISIKITEMMITVGGIGGALFFETVSNKAYYTSIYFGFLFFSLITYINLLSNVKRNFSGMATSFLSSLFFSLVLFRPLDFKPPTNVYDFIPYFGVLVWVFIFSIFQVRGFRKN